MPSTVHFVGAPPIISKQAPLPPWAQDLDGSRKVVLVTQGTFANHNLGLVVVPTLAALANEPDVLVVATTGGRRSTRSPARSPATRACRATCRSSGCCRRSTSWSPTAATAASTRP